MIGTILQIALGIVLSVIALGVVAMILGEKRTLRKECDDYSTLGTIVRRLLIVLFLLVCLTFCFSYWVSSWFLLILIPPILFSIMWLLPKMFPIKQKEGTSDKKEKTYFVTDEKYESNRNYLRNYYKNRTYVEQKSSPRKKSEQEEEK